MLSVKYNALKIFAFEKHRDLEIWLVVIRGH